MDIRVSNRIKSDSSLSFAVDQASKVLVAEAPPTGRFVTADWNIIATEGGGPTAAIIELKMTDPWSGDAAMRFTPDDLTDRSRVETSLLRLWGDLLEDRSHKQIEELHSVGSAAEEG
jgi:hypothetical protein